MAIIRQMNIRITTLNGFPCSASTSVEEIAAAVPSASILRAAPLVWAALVVDSGWLRWHALPKRRRGHLEPYQGELLAVLDRFVASFRGLDGSSPDFRDFPDQRISVWAENAVCAHVRPPQGTRVRVRRAAGPGLTLSGPGRPGVHVCGRLKSEKERSARASHRIEPRPSEAPTIMRCCREGGTASGFRGHEPRENQSHKSQKSNHFPERFHQNLGFSAKLSGPNPQFRPLNPLGLRLERPEAAEDFGPVGQPRPGSVISFPSPA